jgi:hypothetical protein
MCDIIAICPLHWDDSAKHVDSGAILGVPWGTLNLVRLHGCGNSWPGTLKKSTSLCVKILIKAEYAVSPFCDRFLNPQSSRATSNSPFPAAAGDKETFDWEWSHAPCGSLPAWMTSTLEWERQPEEKGDGVEPLLRLLLAHGHGSNNIASVQSGQLAALDLRSECMRMRERRRRMRRCTCGRAAEEEADARPSKQKPRKNSGPTDHVMCIRLWWIWDVQCKSNGGKSVTD